MKDSHSVTQASTSATGAVEIEGSDKEPPFSNTGINECNREALNERVMKALRHSVTQASTSATPSTNRVIATIEPPFSNTGINECNYGVILLYPHEVTAIQ